MVSWPNRFIAGLGVRFRPGIPGGTQAKHTKEQVMFARLAISVAGSVVDIVASNIASVFRSSVTEGKFRIDDSLRGVSMLPRGSMSFGVKWNARGAEALIAEAVKNAEKITERAAHKYASAAKAACPVKTGKLRNSIRVEKSKYEGGGHLVLIGDSETYYWSFIEWGASKLPEHAPYKNFMFRTFKSMHFASD